MSDWRFVAVEGPKGVGKTALCAALASTLNCSDRDQVVITREPTPAFDLQNEQVLRGVELAQAITDDRRAHVAGTIAPALADGKRVICDRYVLSSYVFHTGDAVPSSVITDFNRQFPMPSLNLILTADTSVIRSRLNARGTTTRLQAADSARETARYIQYAKLMETLGAPYKVCDNTDRKAQRVIIGRLTRLLRSDDWSF